MTPPPPSPSDQGPDRGSLAPGHGTPVPVDVSEDLRTRYVWALFLAGPITWFTHFMLVYLVAEAGCTGDGPGLELLDPPVPVLTTLVTTVVALTVVGFAIRWALGRWRFARRELQGTEPPPTEPDLDDEQRLESMAFAGLLLSCLSAVAIVFTAVPALVLGPC